MKFPKHKYGLYLIHNKHKDYYQSSKDYIEQREQNKGYHLNWSSETSREKCIETNQIWELQWYPDTPIGSHEVIGPTFEEVLAKALEIEENE